MLYGATVILPLTLLNNFNDEANMISSVVGITAYVLMLGNMGNNIIKTRKKQKEDSIYQKTIDSNPKLKSRYKSYLSNR